jgi:hypothetical protein
LHPDKCTQRRQRFRTVGDAGRVRVPDDAGAAVDRHERKMLDEQQAAERRSTFSIAALPYASLVPDFRERRNVQNVDAGPTRNV